MEGLLSQQASPASESPAVAEQNGMTPEQTDKFEKLFQAGYDYAFEPKIIQSIIDYAQDNPVNAISTFTAKLITNIVEQTKEQDLFPILAASFRVMSEVIDVLREAGVEISDEDVSEIISDAVHYSIAESPKLQQEVNNDPQARAAMQSQQPATQGVP